MQAEARDQVDAGVGERQPVVVGNKGHARAAGDIGDDRQRCTTHAAAAEVERDGKVAPGGGNAVAQFGGERCRQEIIAGARPLLPARGAVEGIGGHRHCHAPRRRACQPSARVIHRPANS